ncbi:transporter substrate-binding domain-containing protein [Pseudomonas sp. CAU 1711]|uniref:substrate-binding periplasmic protein n=1 Tax=Pseudomonas sp. CAU 1711 TaxID=3140356 RepID=UPI0032602A0D
MKALLALLITLLCSTPGAAFTLCVESADYPPFIHARGEIEQAGLLPQMVQQAALANGTRVELLRQPWKRCIDNVRTGKVDALLALIWSPERDEWVAFPKRPERPRDAPDSELRVWREEYRIFVPLQGTLRYDGKRFEGLRTGIGAPTGYVVWQRLKDAGVLSESVLKPQIGLRLVAMGRLDGYVSERSIGLHLLRSMGLRDQVALLPQVYHQDDSYLVFSHAFRRSQPQLTQAIWQSLRGIRERHAAQLRLDE